MRQDTTILNDHIATTSHSAIQNYTTPLGDTSLCLNYDGRQVDVD